jgi:hypothetical protein
MAVESVRGLYGYGRLHVVVRHLSHVDVVRREFLAGGLGLTEVNVVVVGETSSPLESARRFVRLSGIRGPVAFKDCDNHFRMRVTPGDYAAVVYMPEQASFVRRDNKSYCSYSGFSRKPSDWACAGLYSFSEAQDLLELSGEWTDFWQVMPTTAVHDVEHYLDWGTREDWVRFRRRYGTVFVDIDGVLVRNGSRSFADRLWGDTAVIAGSIRRVNALYHSGRWHVVLVTSRPEEVRRETVSQLAELSYHRLMMGLPAAHRILIGDDDSFGSMVHAVRMTRDEPDWRHFNDITGDFPDDRSTEEEDGPADEVSEGDLR